ncbi:hypothetical protein FA15DRAFT_761080 [Coprinopsis marcescibilis]|uniref:F-box domain-containing protein n=1 Tax=Coprinopsis marcescibilis TaxID=230819 RepID=A0A5C3KBD3_COPMA|nr:hypothetical protein FA15DRAFT_761080 [Coprinopsis marcescibilis]
MSVRLITSDSWLNPSGWASTATRLWSGLSISNTPTRFDSKRSTGVLRKRSGTLTGTPSRPREQIWIAQTEIPPEILHLIFRFVQQLNDQYPTHRQQGESITFQLRPEIYLSHVCHSWRNLALLSTDLWVCFRFKGSTSTSYSHERLQAYVNRSGTRFLDLFIHFKSTHLSDWFGDSQRPRPADANRTGEDRGSVRNQQNSTYSQYSLLCDIGPHRVRWRKLVLSFHYDLEPLDYIQKWLSKTEAPNLQSLVILPMHMQQFSRGYLDGLLGVDQWPDSHLPSDSSPKRSFHISMNGNSAGACVPMLKHVTDLRLEVTWSPPASSGEYQVNWLSWKAFAKVVTLPTLLTLSIQGQPFALPGFAPGYEFPGDTVQMKRIQMPYLKELRYSAYGSSAFEDLVLPNLHAPNLESLTLDRMDPPDNPTFWTPENLRPLSSLKTLRLIDVIEYDGSFTEILAESLTPNISRLVILGQSRSVEKLLLNVAKKGLWPRLETLVLVPVNGRSPAIIGTQSVSALLNAGRKELRVVLVPQVNIDSWRSHRGAVSALEDMAHHSGVSLIPTSGTWEELL